MGGTSFLLGEKTAGARTPKMALMFLLDVIGEKQKAPAGTPTERHNTFEVQKTPGSPQNQKNM